MRYRNRAIAVVPKITKKNENKREKKQEALLTETLPDTSPPPFHSLLSENKTNILTKEETLYTALELKTLERHLFSMVRSLEGSPIYQDLPVLQKKVAELTTTFSNIYETMLCKTETTPETRAQMIQIAQTVKDHYQSS